MTAITPTRVVFFTVKDSTNKIKAILQTVDKHIQKKEKITVLLPDAKSLHFLDNLLWSFPKESFRPHSLEKESDPFCFVSLTLSIAYSHHSSTVFNLCSTPYQALSSVKLLYELEDLTSQDKAVTFQKKFQIYQKGGCSLASGVIS